MQEIEKPSKPFVPEEKTPSEDRLVMLCDGVFAIAITLLVIGIGVKFPNDNPSVGEINNELWKMIPPAISYIITFIILAVYWRFHRNLMHTVKRLDNMFIVLTFVYLAFIAFFPVTSGLLGNYGNDPSVIVLYTLEISGCATSALALWMCATWKHRLVDLSLPISYIRARTFSLLLTPIIYCLSLLLLPKVSEPYYVCFSWILIGPIQRVFKIVYNRWLEMLIEKLLPLMSIARSRMSRNLRSLFSLRFPKMQ